MAPDGNAAAAGGNVDPVDYGDSRESASMQPVPLATVVNVSSSGTYPDAFPSSAEGSTPVALEIESPSAEQQQLLLLRPAQGWRTVCKEDSLPEGFRTVDVPPPGTPWFKKMMAFLGPGIMVSVGYMDPGNWATDLAGGAKFGYMLLFVVLLSNIMAIFLQHLAVKLGVVAGRDLAQACRDQFSPKVSFVLWILCEIAITATDLAEIIGSAIALELLFGIPKWAGVLITASDVFLVLLLQNKRFRWLETVVALLVFSIAGIFVYELAAVKPDGADVMKGYVPSAGIVRQTEALYIAIGIIGATVMPHNLYLHSSIVQTRAFTIDEIGRRSAIKYATIDSTVALMFAFFVNSAILILSSAAFHNTPNEDIADIADAYRLLSPSIGSKVAGPLFAVALLASGQNSTFTGTISGQVVMEGFLQLRVRPWVRRLITRALAIIPAAFAALFWTSGFNDLLVLSQVILSLQLPFAVIPLVMFTSQRAKMGEFTNKLWMTVTTGGIAVLIVGLNIYLLVNLFVGAVA